MERSRKKANNRPRYFVRPRRELDPLDIQNSEELENYLKKFGFTPTPIGANTSIITLGSYQKPAVIIQANRTCSFVQSLVKEISLIPKSNKHNQLLSNIRIIIAPILKNSEQKRCFKQFVNDNIHNQLFTLCPRSNVQYMANDIVNNINSQYAGLNIGYSKFENNDREEVSKFLITQLSTYLTEKARLDLEKANLETTKAS